MKPAVLFIEKSAPHLIEPLAVAAKKKGLATLFVHPTAYTVGEGDLYDASLPSDQWSYEALDALAGSLRAQYDIRAVLGVHGLFNGQGLLGAHVARLAENRGLASQGSQALYRANNKYLMRDALRAVGVPTVDFGLATDVPSLVLAARRIGFPVILKPLIGVASSLIFKCVDECDLLVNFELALERLKVCAYQEYFQFPHTFRDARGREMEFDPANSMLVEKYIPGREASVECLITEEEVIPLLVHDKIGMSEGARIVYEDILVTPSVRFSQTEVSKMRDYAVEVARAVGIKNCFAHVELRYDAGSSGPQLLEINPRLGGMCVRDSLEAIVGVNAAEIQIELALGLRFPHDFAPRTDALHAMFALYPQRGGVLTELSGVDALQALPGVLEARGRYKVGARIGGDDEECFLVTCWMRGESLDHVWKTYAQAKQLVQIQVE